MVGRLIKDLEGDCIETRDAAEARLRLFGLPAVPSLQRALRSSDLETRSRSRSALEHLWDQQENRWRTSPAVQGGQQSDVEITGLALLCFLAAGYTHMSRDEFSDPLNSSRRFKYGEIVKKGILWLTHKAEAEGTFDAGDPVADAVASLAILEAYGCTASVPLKEPAELAAGRITRLQRSGSRFSAWKSMALGSANLDDIPGPFGKELEVLEKESSVLEDFLGVSAGSILKARRSRVRDADHAGRLLQSMEDKQTPEERLFTTLAIFQTGGTDSIAWKAWSSFLPDWLLSTRPKSENHCGDGAWEGESLEEKLKTTALHLLTLSASYRYVNHFGLSGAPIRDHPIPEPMGKPH